MARYIIILFLLSGLWSSSILGEESRRLFIKQVSVATKKSSGKVWDFKDEAPDVKVKILHQTGSRWKEAFSSATFANTCDVHEVVNTGLDVTVGTLLKIYIFDEDIAQDDWVGLYALTVSDQDFQGKEVDLNFDSVLSFVYFLSPYTSYEAHVAAMEEKEKKPIQVNVGGNGNQKIIHEKETLEQEKASIAIQQKILEETEKSIEASRQELALEWQKIKNAHEQLTQERQKLKTAQEHMQSSQDKIQDEWKKIHAEREKLSAGWQQIMDEKKVLEIQNSELKKRKEALAVSAQQEVQDVLADISEELRKQLDEKIYSWIKNAEEKRTGHISLISESSPVEDAEKLIEEIRRLLDEARKNIAQQENLAANLTQEQKEKWLYPALRDAETKLEMAYKNIAADTPKIQAVAIVKKFVANLSEEQKIVYRRWKGQMPKMEKNDETTMWEYIENNTNGTFQHLYWFDKEGKLLRKESKKMDGKK